MRTPYPSARVQPDHAAIETVWRRTRASVLEYAAHPIASCAVSDCERLVRRGQLCTWHTRTTRDKEKDQP